MRWQVCSTGESLCDSDSQGVRHLDSPRSLSDLPPTRRQNGLTDFNKGAKCTRWTYAATGEAKWEVGIRMTLSVVWLRTKGEVQELVFASDSRLSGGMRWDGCPKILSLPRSDCMISFAGDTAYAYPMALQIVNAISFYPRSRDRRMDISDARPVFLDVFNGMRSEIKDHWLGAEGPGDPGTTFIFGGFSWKASSFKIWTLHYDKDIDRFTFRPTSPWGGQSDGNYLKHITWMGDRPAVREAKKLLADVLRERGRLVTSGFDMEPFEVLRDVIRGQKHDTVGGAPQIAKVYRSLQSQYFSVLWPDANGSPHAAGRVELDYEHFALPVIDPDSPDAHSYSARQTSEPPPARPTPQDSLGNQTSSYK